MDTMHEDIDVKRRLSIAESRAAELEDDCACLREQLVTLEQQKIKAESALYESQEDSTHEIMETLSWRITRPLRWIQRVFRPQRGT